MKIFRFYLSITVFVFFLISQQSFSQFQNSNAHLGIFSESTVQNTVELEWKFKTGGAVRSTPVIDNGNIIFGSTDGNVYCLSLDGKEQWKFTTEGPVSSSPIINNGVAYFSCRKNFLYAVSERNGKLQWKKKLGESLTYERGFDYYIGSPSVEDERLYIGSADGNLYAFNINNGKELWRFKATSIIRSTPAIDKRNIYFGDYLGKVFAVNKMNGSLVWTFSTFGDTINNEQYPFDRKAILASPTLSDDKLFIGSRDGFLYALNTSTGKELWHYDYHISWIISTVAIKDNILITGTSDGRFFHALNINDGKEIWRFKTNGPVWASPFISGNDIVVIPSNDGYTYALELKTGNELWRFRVGTQIFSAATALHNNIYFGSDDGNLYSLRTTTTSIQPLQSIKRAVFWMKDPMVQSFRYGMDTYVRDYFIAEGYEFYDETDVANFLKARIQSDTASVLVFATNFFIPAITNDTLGSNLLTLYLNSGGKVVILGMNPASYVIDQEKKQVTGVDFLVAKKITGIDYQFSDLRSHRGFYSAQITDEGKLWGLQNPIVGICGLPLGKVTTPLAIDENGLAPAWVKQFGSKKGSGFVQLFLTPDRLNNLPEIKKVAEYGLR